MATIQVRALWDSIDTQIADYSVATVVTFPVGVFNINSLNETQLQDLADALSPYLSPPPPPPPPITTRVLAGTGNSLMAAYLTNTAHRADVIAQTGMALNAGWGPGTVTWQTSGATNNAGIAGTNWAAMSGSTGPTTTLDSWAGSASATTVRLLLAWEDVNSKVLVGNSVAVAYAAGNSYLAARRAHWDKIVRIPMLSTLWDSVTGAVYNSWETTDRYTMDTAIHGTNSAYDASIDISTNPVLYPHFSINSYPWSSADPTGANSIHRSGRGYTELLQHLLPTLATQYQLSAIPSAASALPSKIRAYFSMLPDVSGRAVSVDLATGGSGAPLWSEYGFDPMYPPGATGKWSQTANGWQCTASNSAACSEIYGDQQFARPAGGLTVCGWVTPAETASGMRDLWSMFGFSAGSDAWILGAGLNAFLEFGQSDRYWFAVCPTGVYTTKNIAIASSGPVVGQRDFVCAKWDPTAGTISISVNNGTPVSVSSSGPLALTDTSKRMGLGTRLSALLGTYRGWVIADQALTAGEITYLYNGGTPRTGLFV